MEEIKQKKRWKETGSLWMARFFNNFLVLKNWAMLTMFVFSFAFFTFVLRISDLGRILISLYGLFVILLCLFLVGEYVLKTVKLQRSPLRIYSSILSVNTVFGLIFPLIYANTILAVVIRSLHYMTYYGTFWCKMRMSIVNFYYNTGIYVQLNNIIFWIIILTLGLFIFGGLIERILIKRNL